MRSFYGEVVPKSPEPVLGTIANDLAASLSRVINDQLQAQCEQSGILFDNYAIKVLKYQQKLYPIVMSALVLKMQLYADCKQYGARWVGAGEQFDPGRMIGEKYRGGFVVASCFPGLSSHDAGTEHRVRVCRVRVWNAPAAEGSADAL